MWLFKLVDFAVEFERIKPAVASKFFSRDAFVCKMSALFPAVYLEAVGQVFVVSDNAEKIRPLIGPGTVAIPIGNETGKTAIYIVAVFDQAGIEVQ